MEVQPLANALIPRLCHVQIALPPPSKAAVPAGYTFSSFNPFMIWREANQEQQWRPAGAHGSLSVTAGQSSYPPSGDRLTAVRLHRLNTRVPARRHRRQKLGAARQERPAYMRVAPAARPAPKLVDLATTAGTWQDHLSVQSGSHGSTCLRESNPSATRSPEQVSGSGTPGHGRVAAKPNQASSRR